MTCHLLKKNPKKSPKSLLDLKSEFSKFIGYVINILKNHLFSYMNNFEIE